MCQAAVGQPKNVSAAVPHTRRRAGRGRGCGPPTLTWRASCPRLRLPPWGMGGMGDGGWGDMSVFNLWYSYVLLLTCGGMGVVDG